MRDVQLHLVKLLKEIDDICVRHNLHYILCGRTAKDACTAHAFVGDYVYASVMMPEEDLAKFARYVAKESHGDRVVAGLRENPAFPEYGVRYVDENTTFLYGDSAHRYIHKGIFITIQRCRNIPKEKRKARLVKQIDTVIACRKDEGLTGRKGMAVRMLRLGMRVFGEKLVIRKLLGLQQRLVREPSDTLAYVRYKKPDISIPRSMFAKVKRVTLEGESFFVPSSTDAYLRKVYGAKWASDMKPETVRALHLLVASADVSYRDLDPDGSLYQGRPEMEQIIRERSELNKRIDELRNNIDKNYDLLFFTQERYRLHRRYMPVMEQLRQRRQKGDYPYLLAAMKDYLDAVETYLPKDLPISVNEELDALAAELLSYSGRFEQSKRYTELKKTVPLKEIDIRYSEERTEELRDEAMADLPLLVEPRKDGGVPVCVQAGERSVEVARRTSQCRIIPLMEVADQMIVPTGEEDSLGEPCVTVYRREDETYGEFIGSEVWEQIFQQSDVAELYQLTADDRRVSLGYLSRDGKVWPAVTLKEDMTTEPAELPTLCHVEEDGSVPVSVYDREKDSLLPVFCLDGAGRRVPVVTLGLAGIFTIATAEDGKTALYYEGENGSPEPLDMRPYLDDALSETVRTVFLSQEPVVCMELVQRDVFSHIALIAALLDDGHIVPAGRLGEGNALVPEKIEREPSSVLYLQGKDGQVPVAVLRRDGTVLPAGTAPAARS